MNLCTLTAVKKFSTINLLDCRYDRIVLPGSDEFLQATRKYPPIVRLNRTRHLRVQSRDLPRLHLPKLVYLPRAQHLLCFRLLVCTPDHNLGPLGDIVCQLHLLNKSSRCRRLLGLNPLGLVLARLDHCLRRTILMSLHVRRMRVSASDWLSAFLSLSRTVEVMEYLKITRILRDSGLLWKATHERLPL